MSNYNITDLADNLNYINETKSIIRNAIVNKGQNIDINTPFRDYSQAITNISGRTVAGEENIDSYRFKNLDEMNAFSINANDGDYGIVYDAYLNGITGTGVYNNVLLPNRITFDIPITNATEISLRPTTKNANGANRINYSISPDRIYLQHRVSKIGSYINTFIYTSTDGKRYYYDYVNSNDIINIYTLTLNMPCNYTNLFEKIFITDYGYEYNGLYKYNSNNNSWDISNTQLNAEVTNILNNKTAYTNINLIGNMFSEPIDGSNNLEVQNFALRAQSIITNAVIVGNMNGWNASNVYCRCNTIKYAPQIIAPYNLCNAYAECTNLLIPDIYTNSEGTWDIDSTSNMFRNCWNLIVVPQFTANNIKDMSNMFHNCNMLTSIPELDTVNTTNMSYLFSGCSNLINIPDLDTNNVIDISGMFYRCTNLVIAPNFNTINVTDMHDMFSQCNNLTTVPNYNTSKVTSMYGTFQACYKVTYIPNFDTSNVTNMSYTFFNCQNLVDVPQLNTSNVINLSHTFGNCNNLSDASIQNIINMILNSNVTNTTMKNLNNTNTYSPFASSNISSSRYSNRLTELSAAGWSY